MFLLARRALRRSGPRRALVVAASLALGTGLLTVPATTADAEHEGTLAPAARVASDSPGVMANMFEWNWTSVGKECRDVLGPAGFGGVQVSPPQDSVKRQRLGDGSDTILHPWWEVYQPVDYSLTSRMGTEAQFKAMVKTCRKAGVKVYVDAVINHMTGQGDTSYGGVTYQPYTYDRAGYTSANFHVPQGECPSSDGGIQDYNNKAQVFRCNLVGLQDLRTQTPYVQNKLAAYLNTLLSYGVSGFRVDAAKHIGQDDLDAIYAKLDNTREGKRPYWALEVFGGGPGILSPQAFTRSGTVLGLDGVKQIRDAFKSYANQGGSIATLEVFGADSGLTAGAKTLSFVQNHDTERNGDALNYKDGATNILATEWLLASGYGTPQVYSGFTYATNDDSPPADASGLITNTNCTDGTWQCTDRNPGVLSMVGWHNYARQAPQRNWWDDGTNVISFSRGNRAWIALNNGTAAKQITVQTGLPKGRYCDVIGGVKTGKRCTGDVLSVNRNGKITVTVPAKGAVAFDRSDRIK